MTRKEQINAEKTRRYGDSQSAAAYGQRMGFKAGAEWADANPIPENDPKTIQGHGRIAEFFNEDKDEYIEKLESALKVAEDAMNETRELLRGYTTKDDIPLIEALAEIARIKEGK